MKINYNKLSGEHPLERLRNKLSPFTTLPSVVIHEKFHSNNKEIFYLAKQTAKRCLENQSDIMDYLSDIGEMMNNIFIVKHIFQDHQEPDILFYRGQDAADAITEYKLLIEEQKSMINPFNNLARTEIKKLDKKIFNEYVIIEDTINYASEYITSTITKTKINY